MNKHIYKEVYDILDENPSARSFDPVLLELWHEKHPEVDVYWLPTESIYRARRLAQQKNPELQGTECCRKARKNLKDEHRSFFSKLAGSISFLFQK